MEASYTYDHREPDRKDDYMVVASKSEWGAVIRNLNGVGLSLESRKLIEELKSWGIN